MNWDKFDELFASFARPYQMYACSTALVAALIIAVVSAQGELVVVGLGTIVGGLAGGTAVLRTIDIKTKAKAATEDKRTATAGVAPVVPIRTEEVA